ncbi:MAG: class I SAM-dependent methyltransferase [Desertimonas sp.]
MSTDWAAWHAGYDDPNSSLSRRLDVVRQRVGEALDTAPRPRVLSLCAGDGRDLLPGLAERPGERQVTLVELDADLAAGADARAASLRLSGVDVRRGDAGLVATFGDTLPVDLLLLCGIFGNITDADIAATVAAVPAMLTPGGIVIWTRGDFRDRPDMRPVIRRWFIDGGLIEITFDGPPSPFGVGVARWDGPTGDASGLPQRLFGFTR